MGSGLAMAYGIPLSSAYSYVLSLTYSVSHTRCLELAGLKWDYFAPHAL